jgi:hypothetical protein
VEGLNEELCKKMTIERRQMKRKDDVDYKIEADDKERCK